MKYLVLALLAVTPNICMAQTLEQKCERGNASACFDIGIEHNTEGNSDLAIQYFSKACQKGYKAGCTTVVNLQRIHRERPTYISVPAPQPRRDASNDILLQMALMLIRERRDEGMANAMRGLADYLNRPRQPTIKPRTVCTMRAGTYPGVIATTECE